MAVTNRDRAIALAEQIYDALDVDQIRRLPLDAIQHAIADLKALRILMGQCSDADLAIAYLEKMKRPRADKAAEGQRAKDAAYGTKIMAYNMAKE
jgi:hypothetical protein